MALVLAIGLTQCVFALAARSGATWAGTAVVVTGALAVAQVGVEGWRWQMLPAELLTGALVLAWAWQRGADAETGLGRPCLVIGVVMLGLAIALPTALPVFRLPTPTGPDAIGTLTYHWVDAARGEAFTDDPTDQREVMVQIWYPAQPQPAAPRAPYVEDPAVLEPLARLLHLPGFLLSHLRYITTNAVQAAPIADKDGVYPVLIFSHGRGGYRQHNTLEIEELASHGYIVAAIDHPYAASGVIYPDGRRAIFDPRMTERAFVDGKIPYLAQDALFVLQQLTALDQADPRGVLTGRLDLTRVGIFGLSLGGEIATEACTLEPRLRACLAMDVWMPADVIAKGLQQPTLWITRDEATMRLEGWQETDVRETWETMRAVFERMPGDGYFVQIPGMFHQDFSDAALLSPLTRPLGLTGPIDSDRAHAIVNAYTLAFFDRYLKDQPAPLLAEPSPEYPEVLFERR